MKSQPGDRDFDPAEIRKATGIAMPRFPASWRLTDVQVYPAAAGPIVQVAALTDRGEAISFVAMHGDTAAGRTPILTSRKGNQVAYWEEGGLAYGIVGVIPAKRLLLLASQVARES
jgi:anti-sigma factor RsiW